MRLVRTASDLRRTLDEVGHVGFVPTMGSLHEGHLSLLDRAREEADAVVVSIYVNPLQFGPDEDLETYPRDLEGDLKKAESRGADVVFAPSTAEMYPAGEPQVTVDPGPMADRLCGRYRPGHFRGVLTVVSKLFHLVEPAVAIFGRKDFQQGVLIRRMARDLNMDVEVVLGPIVREPDGLALSSRNAYLGPEEREQALGLSAALGAVRDAFAGGTTETRALRRTAVETLERYPGLEPQYVELVEPETLDPVGEADEGSVLALAAFVGDTRLIDNGRLGGEG